MGFSHLNGHNFRHNFRDTLSVMCDCGSEIESTQHFLLHYLFFNDQRKKLFYSFDGIKLSILEFQKDFLTNILLFGSGMFEETINKNMHNQLLVINIAPLTVLFCNCPLADL